MFARSASIALLALPVLASALSLPRGETPGGISNSCNTGATNCCNSLQSADDKSLTGIFGVLGIKAADVIGQVGVTCTPITGIGASGTSCSAQPVCCKNNSFNGIVALGCSPINLNL